MPTPDERADLLRHLEEMQDVAEHYLEHGPLTTKQVAAMMRDMEIVESQPHFGVWDEIKLETAHIKRPTNAEKMAAIHGRLVDFHNRLADAVSRGDKTRERSLQHTIETHLRELERLREAKE